MPRRWLWAIVAASVLLGACSRLTFVRPKLERGEFTQVAPDYEVKADPQAQQRMVAIERVGLAGQLLRDGKLDEAETQAREALKADPDSADAYTLLAVIASQRGQSAQAGENYARAAQLAPGNPGMLNNYGTWLCSNGRAAESLAFFDRALATPGYPTPAAALANAGSCALTAGQRARAEQNLQRAIQLEPKNPVALAALARLAYDSGHYMDARAYSQRRLAAAPGTPDVLLLASQIEQKLGDSEAAARYVQQIRTQFPQARVASPGNTQR